jgi:tripartite-type tricarboxylate transporter receptor subunit TctC
VLKRLLLAIGLATTLATAAAQSAYPTKPIKLIVPFPPGGTTDLLARAVADKLGAELGQTVVVDNRGGAGGTIGAAEIARAAPDGYTLGIATASTHAINPVTQPKFAYDALTDFTPIALLAEVPNVMVVNGNVKAGNAQEFLMLLRAQPGKLTYASPGSGSVGNFMGEAFKSAAKVYMVHIPYRGAGPALNDFLAGTVDVMFDNLPTSLPHIQSGKVRAMAVASPKRVAVLPDVPTFAELGLAAANTPAWFGLVGPAKLPEPVVKRLNDAVQKVLAAPEMRERLAKMGAVPAAGAPAQFATLIRNEIEATRKIAQTAGIKAE